MNDMLAQIITALISGLCVAIPSVLSTRNAIDKNNALQDERITNLQEEIKSLSTKVEAHNTFGLQLAKLEARVEILEKK